MGEKQSMHWVREAVHTLIGHDKHHAYLIEHNIRTTKELEKSLLQSLHACQEQIHQSFARKVSEIEAFAHDKALENDLDHKLSELAYKVEMLCMRRYEGVTSRQNNGGSGNEGQGDNLMVDR